MTIQWPFPDTQANGYPKNMGSHTRTLFRVPSQAAADDIQHHIKMFFSNEGIRYLSIQHMISGSFGKDMLNGYQALGFFAGDSEVVLTTDGRIESATTVKDKLLSYKPEVVILQDYEAVKSPDDWGVPSPAFECVASLMFSDNIPSNLFQIFISQYDGSLPYRSVSYGHDWYNVVVDIKLSDGNYHFSFLKNSLGPISEDGDYIPVSVNTMVD